MKCPTCEVEGEKSKVFIGPSMTTLMVAQGFYDEEGQYHLHDPNQRSTTYSCSRDHSWIHGGVRECWCGWPKKGR